MVPSHDRHAVRFAVDYSCNWKSSGAATFGFRKLSFVFHDGAATWFSRSALTSLAYFLRFPTDPGCSAMLMGAVVRLPPRSVIFF